MNVTEALKQRKSVRAFLNKAVEKNKINVILEVLNYTSHGHECGFYNELIFVDSKALKWTHS